MKENEMSFKENLLKKIRIDETAKKVKDSVGHPDSRRIDKSLMRGLLEMGQRIYRKERDLDLYVSGSPDTGEGNILVLDNDLTIYKTSAEDVALRKSPTVKEMVSIRNAIRILNDSDVVISKKEASVETVRKECINLLDLSFDESDIEMIAKDGLASLESAYTEGVIEALSLFGELLGYVSPPKALQISQHNLIGRLSEKQSGETLFGPIVLYSLIHNTLRLIADEINCSDKEKIVFVQQVAAGKVKASKEGADVFDYLREAVIRRAAIRDIFPKEI